MARKNSEVKVKFVAETQEINNGLKSTQNEIKVLNSQLSLNAEKLKGASGDTNLLSERTSLLSDALAETQKKNHHYYGGIIDLGRTWSCSLWNVRYG